MTVTVVPSITESARGLAAAAVPLELAGPARAPSIAGLCSLLAAADVVGLGESTHGTSELFTLKHHIVRGLVEQHGFTVFALEASAAECRAIDDFVVHGRPPAAAALAGQRLWTWDTDEVLALVKWLRRARLAGHPVRVVGVDMQFPALATQQALAWLADHDATTAQDLERHLWPALDDWAVDQLARRSEAECAATMAAATDLRAAVERAADDASVQRLLAATVEQGVHMRCRMASGVAIRDAAMAANLLLARDALFPGAKVVLWAHNGHVGRAPFDGDAVSMGGHLAAALGEQYVPVALTAGTGEVRVIPQGEAVARPAPLPPADPGGLDDAVARVPHAAWYADLRAVEGPAARWLRTPLAERMIGAALSTRPASRRVVPAEAYDVLVAVRDTTATSARPSAARHVATSSAPEGTEAAGPFERWQLSASGPADVTSLRVSGQSLVLERDRKGGVWGWGQAGRHRVRVPDDATALTLRASVRTKGRSRLAATFHDANGKVVGVADVPAAAPATLVVDVPPAASTVSWTVTLSGGGIVTVTGFDVEWSRQ